MSEGKEIRSYLDGRPVPIRWRNPEEDLPEEGQIVWVVYAHSKEQRPQSYQLMAGTVECDNTGRVSRVQSDDWTGAGSWAVYFPNPWDYSDDVAIAWVPADEINLPEWG
jgi:hypothetical protein